MDKYCTDLFLRCNKVNSRNQRLKNELFKTDCYWSVRKIVSEQFFVRLMIKRVVLSSDLLFSGWNLRLHDTQMSFLSRLLLFR